MLGKFAMQIILVLLLPPILGIPVYAFGDSSKLLARVADCRIPEVPDNAELLYLGMMLGRAGATITFGSPRSVTGVTDVQIEPGDTSIYLIAASTGPMILRFSGHIERLAHVVSVGWMGIGFVGIGQERGAWREGPKCGIRGWDPRVAKGEAFARWGTPAEQLEYVEALAGRPLEKKFIERSFGLVSLPSGQAIEREHIVGQIAPNLDGPYGSAWKELLRAYPNGLIEVAPDDVMSPKPIRLFAAMQ